MTIKQQRQEKVAKGITTIFELDSGQPANEQDRSDALIIAKGLINIWDGLNTQRLDKDG